MFNLKSVAKTALPVALMGVVALPMSSYANPNANLAKLLGNVKSMSADFNQTTKGSKTTTFTGSMSMERPNKFRWDIKSPSEQLIVANANTLWVYDKDLMQATRQSTNDQVGETPALLLSGNPNQIAQNFSVTQPVAGKNYYVLTPKKSTNFQSLSISFNSGKPVMMVLNDNLGQTTTIRFSNIKMNGKIPANTFSFTPPAGVDVIEQ